MMARHSGRPRAGGTPAADGACRRSPAAIRGALGTVAVAVALGCGCGSLRADSGPAAPQPDAAELGRQFEGLQRDLGDRGRFERMAGETFRSEALIHAADRDPADVVVRRTRALFDDLAAHGADLGALADPLAALEHRVAGTPVADAGARRALFDDTCRLRRRIAFRNPLLDFDRILFVKRHRAVFNHMCDQFYGITARPGGGVFVLEDCFGPQPRAVDLLETALVANGRLAGRRLPRGDAAAAALHFDGESTLRGDPTSGGAFLSPALSHDARQVLFAYVECSGGTGHLFHSDPGRGHWDAGRCYHIFRVNLDGTDLRQLTDGTWNDFDPCWLPDGRIAFISERRGGYLRCGRACPLYTLHAMNADGGGIDVLSFHESNEWAPSVAHDGRIVWTRWDYVDRHGCAAHVPWVTRLDGSDPRALHGNFAPRPLRPDMEVHVRAIPGSRRYVATAAPHHGQAFGSLVVIDPAATDDDAMGPVRRLTPEVGFPESQGGREVYGTPWPLGENYHLCACDAELAADRPQPSGRGDYGIYLVDAFGNRELIHHDPAIACMSPIPVRPTPVPPLSADTTAAGHPQPAAVNAPGEGTLAVVNVYDTRRPWPDATRIDALRIWQLLPCSVPSGGRAPHQTGRRIAEAEDSIVPARWLVGTVPVEADGSAHFTAPACRELFFQLLDRRGLAVQSMRSATAVRHAGRLVCAGCHEHKSKAAPATGAVPLAFRRPPSVPAPGPDGSNPFSYPRLVQPVLDRHCAGCHAERRADGAPSLAREPVRDHWFESFHNLVGFGFTAYGATAGWSDPLWYRTEPGRFGARASRLLEILDRGHHRVQLPAADFERLVLWLDACSMFYGVYDKEEGEAQLRGEPGRASLQ